MKSTTRLQHQNKHLKLRNVVQGNKNKFFKAGIAKKISGTIFILVDHVAKYNFQELENMRVLVLGRPRVMLWHKTALELSRKKIIHGPKLSFQSQKICKNKVNVRVVQKHKS